MPRRHAVGELRPSQLLHSYGVGAIINLPHISTLIMGIDDWDTHNSEEISEPRLLQAIKSMLGPQMQRFLTPSSGDGSLNTSAFTGVPVSAFPRWMVCPGCRLLSPIDDNIFTLAYNKYHPDRTSYRHGSCSTFNNPVVLPSRFMIACPGGHLDDFPWHHFVHGPNTACKASLFLTEWGFSGEPSDIVVECRTCHKKRPMSQAFAYNTDDERTTYLPHCTGRSPHLRKYAKKPCPHQAKTTLLSASNTWFPLSYTALSIPEQSDPLDRLIEQEWSILQDATDQQTLTFFLQKIRHLKEQFSEYSIERIWERIAHKQHEESTEIIHPKDLKLPEWRVLTDPLHAPHTDDFAIQPTEKPTGYEHLIEQVVLVERLREVQALTGFTRIESLSDYAEDDELPRDHIMKLSNHAPRWIPATEVRGEGIFIQFREQALHDWLQRVSVQQHDVEFLDAHRRWREQRKMEHPEANYPDIRFVLLHTFSHALIRQLTLECGYAAASIRERIYAQGSDAPGGAMAGVLLYTAASDSEGTLGGLVSLGHDLGYHIAGALDDMQYCASDPLCAEHVSLTDNTLHGSACHACMFIPETSCERGNHYLDRSVLIRTIERSNLAFFHSDEESE